MKQNKRNPDSGDSQTAPKAVKGSTIIAVLAAMVFIGVVTASMVKNTGSQSSASLSYGTIQTMESTVRSGIIATETAFSKFSSAQIKDLLENPNNKLAIYGNTSGKGRQSIASGQYISSVLDPSNIKNNYNIRFQITSGTSPGGRAMKNAVAFYSMDGPRYDDPPPPPSGPGGAGFGTNAFFMGEQAGFQAGNSGMEIIGDATFHTGLKTQNGSPVRFLKDSNGKGSVYIQADISKTPRPLALDILNNDNKVNFDVPVYVDGDTKVQNLPNTNGTLFSNKVGFNGNFSAPDKTIEFGGDVWFNGNFGDDNVKLKGNNNNAINLSTIDKNSTRIEGFTGGKNQLNMTPESIRSDLHMGTLESRREPDLDLANIPPSIIPLSIAARSKKDAYNDSSDLRTTSGKLKPGKDLNNFIKAARTNPKYKDNFYNDHLVVKIPATGDGSTLDFDSSGTAFAEKIIFIVEGAMGGTNATFYNSSDKASTLIYVKKDTTVTEWGNTVTKGGTLQQFGVKNNGTFRGLIYVEPGNTQTQTFSWGINTNVEGAVIMKGGNLTWNCNNCGTDAVTTIRHNDGVLANFGFLVKSGQQNNSNNPTAPPGTPGVGGLIVDYIKLKQYGVYFF